jgi:hypothetical protein
VPRRIISGCSATRKLSQSAWSALHGAIRVQSLPRNPVLGETISDIIVDYFASMIRATAAGATRSNGLAEDSRPEDAVHFVEDDVLGREIDHRRLEAV